MENLSDALLIESYHQAKSLNLAPDFIGLIVKEMEQRDLLLKEVH